MTRTTVTRAVKQAGMRSGVAAVILALASAFYMGAALAHGKETMEEDSCTRRVGDNIVHLSAYQPQFDASAQYCTEIPKGGETYLVVDLVDGAMREMPIGMRVVKGTNETEDETVSLVKPTYHADGVIRGELNLDQGLYTVIITAEGHPPLSYRYPLRVQMINYAQIFRSAVGPLIGLMVLILLVYKLMKSKRMQRWRSSRH